MVPHRGLTLFSAIKAAFAASHRTGLDRLAIDDGSTRFGIATCLGSHMFTQGSHGLLPGAIQLPLTEVIIDRFSVGQIMGICLHEQPVRNRYRMPFTISRRGIGSRGESAAGSGIKGARISHWASVISEGYGFRAS